MGQRGVHRQLSLEAATILGGQVRPSRSLATTPGQAYPLQMTGIGLQGLENHSLGPALQAELVVIHVQGHSKSGRHIGVVQAPALQQPIDGYRPSTKRARYSKEHHHARLRWGHRACPSSVGKSTRAWSRSGRPKLCAGHSTSLLALVLVLADDEQGTRPSSNFSLGLAR